MGKKDKIYKIHPAIGIARVGNADADDYLPGPSIPEANESLDKKKYAEQFSGPNKKDGKIRPQSTSFTIWEYDKLDQKPLREIHLDEKDVESIGWYVHIANLKASFLNFRLYAGELMLNDSGSRNKGKPEEWMMDPSYRTISGRNIGSKDKFRFKEGTSADPAKEKWIKDQNPDHRYLGELLTDGQGRLIFIGGKGNAGFVNKKFKKLKYFSETETWYDDVSDGYVKASIKFKRRKDFVDAQVAWVLVAPPDFAPEIRGAVTLYDLLVDKMIRSKRLSDHKILANYPNLKELADDFKSNAYTTLTTYKPKYHDDIYPILVRAANYRYTYKFKTSYHGSFDMTTPLEDYNNNDPASNPVRQYVFNKMRPPGTKGDKDKNMPMLLGDSNGELDDPYLSLTVTQYEMLRRWSEGNFEMTTRPTGIKLPIALDIANLENASGGAFYPGVDVGWQIRNIRVFGEPFRVDPAREDPYLAVGMKKYLEPGHFTRNMAVPWQADFEECRSNPKAKNYPFWPSQRPVAVPGEVKGKKTMVPWFRNAKGKELFDMNVMAEKWFENGFLVRDPATGEFVEKERGKI